MAGAFDELREHGIPVSWVALLLLAVGGSFFGGIMVGRQQRSDDFQRGLKAGFGVTLGHPELREKTAAGSR